MPAGPELVSAPRVAVCMATYEPDPGLLERQIESIRKQAGVDWHCFISDDASGAEAVAVIEELIEGDDRFTFSRSAVNLGFYRNFERAIGMATDDYELLALSDQDDVWHSDKLRSLVTGLGAAQLVYRDPRLVVVD